MNLKIQDFQKNSFTMLSKKSLFLLLLFFSFSTLNAQITVQVVKNQLKINDQVKDKTKITLVLDKTQTKNKKAQSKSIKLTDFTAFDNTEQTFGIIKFQKEDNGKIIFWVTNQDKKGTGETIYFCKKKQYFTKNEKDCTDAVVVTPKNDGENIELYDDLTDFVKSDAEDKGYKYIGGQSNILIDDVGIIHIYLNEDGNPIYTDFPVSAKENYDKFQFHVIGKKDLKYVFKSKGTLNPKPVETDLNKDKDEAEATSGVLHPSLKVHHSQIFGPYTTSFPFTIERDGVEIVKKKIPLLKTSRVSLGTSVIASWIKNAENIETFVRPDGQTTLIADNSTTRAYLGLFLTFHLAPRNLNIQPLSLIHI